MDSLIPCPYRKHKLGHLLCTITDTEVTENSTNLTTANLCSECSVPEVIQQVNCTHLIQGKEHLGSSTFQGFNISESDIHRNCKFFGFAYAEEYKSKCSPNCPAYQPLHKDLSTESPISVEGFDLIQANDRKLRQAILAVLYKYHAKYPERYQLFDVTPEFVANSLGISANDAVRVVCPMEDEGEVATFRYASDIGFKYVRITSKGIRMIDEEPLFERLDTAGIRIMGDQININLQNSQVSEINAGRQHQNHNETHQKMGINATELKELFIELRSSINTLPSEQKQEASELVNALEKEAESPKPNQSRVKALIEKIDVFFKGIAEKALAIIAAKLIVG